MEANVSMDTELLAAIADNASARKPESIGIGIDGKERIAIPQSGGAWRIDTVEDPAKTPEKIAPDRIRLAPTFHDTESFCEYVKEFKDRNGDKTQLFADVESLAFMAALDFHNPAPDIAPSLMTHKASFAPRRDAVFAEWMNHHKKKMSQEAFGRFLETHAPEISSPDPADILEIAMDLNIKINITYQSRKDLGNGLVGFEFKETADDGATSTKATLRMPKEMIVHMPVFFGEKPVQFKVMIRYYPQKDQPLTFSIEIHRVEYEIESAFLAIRDRIGEAVGLKPKLGRLARG